MKRRKGKTERDKTVRALDAITPKIVKLRDVRQCQRCGSFPDVRGCHWAHIYGRSDFRLRWDLLNALVLCYGCHQWFDSNGREGPDWHAEKWPARAMHIDCIRASPRTGTISTKVLKELLESHKLKYNDLVNEFS